MLPKPTCLKWIIVFVLLLMMPLAYAGNLHWQPESRQTEYHELKVSFNARDHHDKTGRQSDPLTITGRPGQLLLACSRLWPEGTEGLAVQTVNDEYQMLALTRQQASLTFDSVKPCSSEWLSEYPYQWRQTLVSDEPFLVWQEPGKQRHRRNSDKALGMPVDLSSQTRELLASIGGGSSGFDDDNYHNPPPFIPLPEQAGSSITLLPILRLLPFQDEWRAGDMLSGNQWWHWLMEEPDYASGVTVQLRIPGQPP